MLFEPDKTDRPKLSAKMKHFVEMCIMDYSPEEYTRFYIVQALFKLMNEYQYENINVSDIAKKAGVGRATFYRYFKRKEDVIEFYFNHNTAEFLFEQRFFPRCKEDYIKIAEDVFEKFRKNKECFKLIKRAHLEYLYLDFLNKKMVEMFSFEYPDKNAYSPYIFAGMIFNVSMAWLDNDCAEPVDTLSKTFMDIINLSK